MVRLRLVLRGVSPLIVRTIEVLDAVTLAVGLLRHTDGPCSLHGAGNENGWRRLVAASGLVCGRFVRPRQVAFSTSCGVL